jgi:hypothetical protein
MASRNTNTDFQQKVKNDEGKTQAYYFNNLALLDPANVMAGRPRKLTTLKSTTDLTTGRINNALSLTDQFKIYSTIPLRSLYPGFYPTAVGALTPLAYTGTYRTITVPDGVVYLMVMMWGGGGQSSVTPGGAGAYIEGYLPITVGEQLRFIVAAGGQRGKTQSDVDGGGGGVFAFGGGRTAIQRFVSGTWIDVVVAGGGGAGSLPESSLLGGGGDATATGIAYVGRAGVTAKSRVGINNNASGGGGGQTSGGTGGNGNSSSTGAKGLGGNSTNYSGGGGGGWYGGGGGNQGPPNHGAGGGGSSYGNLLERFIGADGENGIAGNSGSPYRLNNAGNANNDGLLYYQYYKYLP